MTDEEKDREYAEKGVLMGRNVVWMVTSYAYLRNSNVFASVHVEGLFKSRKAAEKVADHLTARHNTPEFKTSMAFLNIDRVETCVDAQEVKE